MPAAPSFDEHGYHVFDDRSGNKVLLHKMTWEQHVVNKPDRRFLVNHFDRIAETLADPDCVERSAQNPNRVVYFRRYREWTGSAGKTLKADTWGGHLTIVVDESTHHVVTVFPGASGTKGGAVIHERTS
ncbi:MAG: hypothetical protein HY719_02395 [Planctomycetes bacterium]|nr:hypothetical protein [Planctomycetota bacterium]